MLSLFDYTVGAAKQRKRYGKAECECLSGFRMERWKGISIDENFKFDAMQQPAHCSLFIFFRFIFVTP
jgi:hypothetical protein